MTPQTGKQTIAIHILPNISRSKENEAMKFGRLIEYNKRNNFFKIHEENEARETIRRFLFVFQKNSMRSKSNSCAA